MILLSVGTHKMRELIEWFNIRPDSFYSHKKEYLKKLRDYCSYKKIDDRTIEIQNVYIPFYNLCGERSAIRRNAAFSHYWSKTGIDCIELLMNKLREAEPRYRTMRDDTIEGQIKDWLREYYGYKTDAAGFKGNAYDVFCTIDENGQFQFLTSEQEKLLHFLFQKYFGKDIIATLFFCAEEGYEEFTGNFIQRTNFSEYRFKILDEFKEVTGMPLTTGISLVDFEEEDDEEEIEEGQYINEGARIRL